MSSSATGSKVPRTRASSSGVSFPWRVISSTMKAWRLRSSSHRSLVSITWRMATSSRFPVCSFR